MSEMPGLPVLQTKGFYRSDLMQMVYYVGDERKTDDYYQYYKFLPEGIWVGKHHASPQLNLDIFIRHLDFDLILDDPDHDEPMNSDREFFYQCGRYTLEFDRVRLLWKSAFLETGEKKWEFIIRSPKRLETVLSDYRYTHIF